MLSGQVRIAALYLTSMISQHAELRVYVVWSLWMVKSSQGRFAESMSQNAVQSDQKQQLSVIHHRSEHRQCICLACLL